MESQNVLLNLVQSDLAKGVVVQAQASSIIFKALPWINVNSNAYEYNVINDMPVPSFRDLGENVIGASISPIKEVELLKIMSADVLTDRALTLYQNINDIRAEQTGVAVDSMMQNYESLFFYGTGSMKDFKGLLPRLGVVGKEFNGTITGLKANVETEMELLDQALDYVQGVRESGKGFIFVSPTTKRALNKLCRNGGVFDTVEAFGRSVLAYDGVPIIPIESITGNEIFVCKFDEANGISGLTCGGLKSEDMGMENVNYRTMVEMLCGVAVKHPRAFAVIRPKVKTK